MHCDGAKKGTVPLFLLIQITLKVSVALEKWVHSRAEKNVDMISVAPFKVLWGSENGAGVYPWDGAI